MRNLLPELRQAQGLTQEGLAAALGISRQTVISIERGKFDPSLPLAFRFAAHFDKSIEQVFFPDNT
jgi:putative transcriptional regulator